MSLSILMAIIKRPQNKQKGPQPPTGPPEEEGLIWRFTPSSRMWVSLLLTVGYCANGSGIERAFLEDCERLHNVGTNFSGKPVPLR